MTIPEQHKSLLRKTRKYFISLNKDEMVTKEEKFQIAHEETVKLYEEHGYNAIRFAYNNAKGKSSFVAHCRHKSAQKSKK